MPFIIFDAFAFILGCVVGSFLNVCIVRMPKEESVVFPSSHCMNCKKPIQWYDNIPLVSYLALGGRCRFCKTQYSFRYFGVELFTGLTFLALFKFYGFDPKVLAYFFMAGCFIVATLVDFEHRIIPDQISLGGWAAGLVFSLLIPSLHLWHDQNIETGQIIFRIVVPLIVVAQVIASFVEKKKLDQEDQLFVAFGFGIMLLEFLLSIWVQHIPATSYKIIAPYVLSFYYGYVGSFVSAGLIYLIGILGDLIFRKESMGGGDIKLMAMVGAFLGWKLSVLGFFISPFFGAVYGIIEKIRTKDSHMAFGPFLILGSLIALFYGERIINWIMSGYGLY